MSKLNVFVSSVEKELELERATIATVITTDPFLLQHCNPVLFENGPPPSRPASKPYLDALKSSQIYLLMLDHEYGTTVTDLSATHEEYRLAQKLNLPTIILVQGASAKDKSRQPRTQELFQEIKRDGHTYRRFHDREDLKPKAREALLRVLADEHHLTPSSQEDSDGGHLIESASPFESNTIAGITTDLLDQKLLADYVELVLEEPGMRIWEDAPEHALVSRGLAVPSPHPHSAAITHAAFVLFAPKPANRLPQCAILLDAYDEAKITGKPTGQETVNGPILSCIDQVLKFVDSHTLHPRRVVGLNNIRLDEYPVKALRESLVNALAHRSYEDSTRKISIRLFSDRLEVASPGYPLKPLTLARLRKGNYRPCSRNPLIAQTLAEFQMMEQRGSGFARMRDAMLDHGLTPPHFDQQDGYFVVTFHGPNGDFDKLRSPEHAPRLVSPAVEAGLSQRQKQMVAMLLAGEELTSRHCQEKFHVSAPILAQDFATLMASGLAEKLGAGRTTRYRMKPTIIIK